MNVRNWTKPAASGERLEKDFPYWAGCFTPRERETMIHDDLQASRVALILAAIVAVGVMLAIVSVWITA